MSKKSVLDVDVKDVEEVSEHVKDVEVENVETDCESMDFLHDSCEMSADKFTSKATEMVILKQRIAGIERNFLLMESILQSTKERLEASGGEYVREL